MNNPTVRFDKQGAAPGEQAGTEGPLVAARFWQPGHGAVHRLIVGEPDARYADVHALRIDTAELGISLVDATPGPEYDDLDALYDLWGVTSGRARRLADEGRRVITLNPNRPLVIGLIDMTAVMRGGGAAALIGDLVQTVQGTGVALAIVAASLEDRDLGGPRLAATIRSLLWSAGVAVWNSGADAEIGRLYPWHAAGLEAGRR
jgi:hypothetical protein